MTATTDAGGGVEGNPEHAGGDVEAHGEEPAAEVTQHRQRGVGEQEQERVLEDNQVGRRAGHGVKGVVLAGAAGAGWSCSPAKMLDEANF